jgi:hypothetical protein
MSDPSLQFRWGKFEAASKGWLSVIILGILALGGLLIVGKFSF